MTRTYEISFGFAVTAPDLTSHALAVQDLPATAGTDTVQDGSVCIDTQGHVEVEFFVTATSRRQAVESATGVLLAAVIAAAGWPRDLLTRPGIPSGNSDRIWEQTSLAAV